MQWMKACGLLAHGWSSCGHDVTIDQTNQDGVGDVRLLYKDGQVYHLSVSPITIFYYYFCLLPLPLFRVASILCLFLAFIKSHQTAATVCGRWSRKTSCIFLQWAGRLLQRACFGANNGGKRAGGGGGDTATVEKNV